MSVLPGSPYLTSTGRSLLRVYSSIRKVPLPSWHPGRSVWGLGALVTLARLGMVLWVQQCVSPHSAIPWLPALVTLAAVSAVLVLFKSLNLPQRVIRPWMPMVGHPD